MMQDGIELAFAVPCTCCESSRRLYYWTDDRLHSTVRHEGQQAAASQRVDDCLTLPYHGR